MDLDVPGKVRNTALPAGKPLLPLYEAVVNSIQAIEDASAGSGSVTITVIRDVDNLFQDKPGDAPDIYGFDVEDDGVGFNNANFSAFQTGDTTYKVKRGGKGNGRFTWLVAFDRVEVESVFEAADSMSRRRFQFTASTEGIQDAELADTDQPTRSTRVSLRGFRKKYREQCPKRLETIGAHLIEHCLEYFIRGTCPTMYLVDGASGQRLDLNHLFEKEMADNAKTSTLEICGKRFRVLHVQLRTSHITEPLVHFCADYRVVKSERLIGKIPNLTKRLQEKTTRPFVYAAYVDGILLDESVNAQRTDFAIDEDGADLIETTTTWKDIRAGIYAECAKYLSPFTEPIRLARKQRIRDYVETSGPMYHTILKYVEDKIELSDPNMSDEQLDVTLYQAYYELQVSVREQGYSLLNSVKKDTEWDTYKEKVQEYFEKLTDINAADLARYVCHRHAVLDFLGRQLGTDDNGTYRREARIHEIVFPLGKTSDEVSFHDHNLWIIDETLAFHAFLASDKPLRTNPDIAINSGKEPDLLVAYNKACAFATGDAPYSAMSIIEFKRPMLSGYSDDENPFVQVREYLTNIRDGKARTRNGRDIPVSKDMPFHCYIVADVSSKLRQYASDWELTETPDGQGFYGYKRAYNAYIEVASYTKIINDAKKRNAAFFTKLGLPQQFNK